MTAFRRPREIISVERATDAVCFVSERYLPLFRLGVRDAALTPRRVRGLGMSVSRISPRAEFSAAVPRDGFKGRASSKGCAPRAWAHPR